MGTNSVQSDGGDEPTTDDARGDATRRGGDSRLSRRGLLRAGAATATLAVTGLSGCTSSVPGIGGGGTNYTNLLYEPGTVRDTDHYRTVLLRPRAIDENEDEYEEDTFERMETAETLFEPTGVDFDEFDEIVVAAGGTVTVGTAEFTESDVVEELDDNDVDDDDEVGNYAVYYDDDATVGFGINGSTLLAVRATGEEDAEDVMEAVVDTGNGDEPRYVDENEAYATLADELSGATIATARTSEPGQGNPGGDIAYGETVSGALTASDPTGYRGYYDSYNFFGSEGDRVEISMQSDNDPYLILLDPDGNRVAANDDSNGLQPRINTRLETTGSYEIIATSFDDRATFDYRLSLRATGSEAAPGLENEVGRGTGATVDGDTAELQTVLVFEEADDVDTGDVEDWADEAARFEEADDVSVSTNGTAAVVSGTVDTDELPVDALLG